MTKDESNRHISGQIPENKRPGARQRVLADMRLSHIMSRSWRTKAAIFLVFASILSGVATYAALNEAPPFGNNPDYVIWLLNIDLIILLLLASFIARRVVGLWSGRKRKIAGSHLHVRLVYIFSILAALPTIVMTVFSAFFFHYGVQAWFSQRVQTAVNESSAVAKAYLDEHMQVIRADTMAMAQDLDRQADLLLFNPAMFDKVMDTQSMLRNLSEAVVFRENGEVVAHSSLTFALEYEAVPNYMLEDARRGDVVLMTGENKDRVRALVKLKNFDDMYLFVGRLVDPQVLSHLSAAQEAVDDYANLKARFSGLQITVTMIFVVVGLLVLLAGIWFGLVLARQLVRPIGELIEAADRVRGGDLSVRISAQKDLEEFDYLALSFNRMTAQIQEQQGALIDANRQIDQRRRLIEAVLSGVSSGVIGADGQGVINLANTAAVALLGLGQEDLIDRRISDVLPEIADLLSQAQVRGGKLTQAEITYTDSEGVRKVLLFSIVMDTAGDSTAGMILTFDDITELQSAQRKAAWSDVARRIAHEIKNPLTPIQLSAERLKRKYLGQISEDQDTFVQCTDTIIKHVSDIGRMVNEFSSFARMPEPVFEEADLISLVRESLVLPMQAERGIKFSLRFEDGLPERVDVRVDPRQIRQALTNILQNACDAIHMGQGDAGVVDLVIGTHGKDEFFLSVADSGAGFPRDVPAAKLTEPYVTHKPKGTGLGLAIVKKIMEDHQGRILLGAPEWLSGKPVWMDQGGACVVFLFPTLQMDGARPADKKEQKNEKVA